ncbi:MAG: hypothetical protein HQL06_08240 [Nitrospirae bacterium]|nr:hypothetical protein [Nitrospirota bacterium]
MLRATQEVLKALAVLRVNPQWQWVTKWFEVQLVEQSLQNNSQRDDVLLRMGQGRALILKELITLFNCPVDERICQLQNQEMNQGVDNPNGKEGGF